MKNTILTCDCGCKQEIEKKNPFVLSKTEIPGPTGKDLDDLKIAGELHFLNLEHLHWWVSKALKAAPVLKEQANKNPQYRGSIYHQEVPWLYI